MNERLEKNKESMAILTNDPTYKRIQEIGNQIVHNPYHPRELVYLEDKKANKYSDSLDMLANLTHGINSCVLTGKLAILQL
ncbi:hypothetical protein J4461_03875 [Candidatus Pacearchaeota archaeon]|nr:hypothetical protein [Candidatus Pacearchaeota archaeon]